MIRSVIALSMLMCAAAAHAQLPPPHPLETRALVEPDAVLAALPPLREAAEKAGDFRELGRLGLAEANACRVIANWRCQRKAAQAAADALARVDERLLRVRALILLGRAQSNLHDYSAASRNLAQAREQLGDTPAPEVLADVLLAYSSVSREIGKSDLCVSYARQGLGALPEGTAQAMRVRLLRNLANCLTASGQVSEARQRLSEAETLVRGIDDPKLQAEIWLEVARSAQLLGDAATTRRMAELISAQGARLQNSQLVGLAHETYAYADRIEGKLDDAAQQFNEARASFEALSLDRDQLRVVRAIVDLELVRPGSPGLAAAVRRLDKLYDSVTARDRREAADDFDERQAYIEREGELATLSAKSALEAERADRLRHESLLTRIVAGLALTVALVLAVLYLLQRRLNQRIERAHQQRLNTMLRTSHDIRNPLQGILGVAELLLTKPLPADQKQLVHAIRDAGVALGDLAQDLLDSGRLESGKLRLLPRPTSLTQLVDGLATLNQTIASDRKLGFECQVDPSLPASVEVDPQRLHQVLDNLVGNALKFTERGGVRVKLTRLETGDLTRTRVRFEVTDSGPGIAAADLARLFAPFEKGSAGERHGQGAGLGLSIAKELVELMGGDLQVDSGIGRGTRFHFDLDLAVTVAPAPQAVEAAEPPPSTSLNLRVLMVDDDSFQLELCASFLEALGCRVQRSRSGQEALVEAGIRQFEVVLMDYELPDMDGHELANRIRSLQMTGQQRPRLIMLSGHPPSAERGLDFVDAWLVKPVSLERLRNVLLRPLPELEVVGQAA